MINSGKVIGPLIEIIERVSPDPRWMDKKIICPIDLSNKKIINNLLNYPSVTDIVENYKWNGFFEEDSEYTSLDGKTRIQQTEVNLVEGGTAWEVKAEGKIGNHTFDPWFKSGRNLVGHRVDQYAVAFYRYV